MAGGVIEATLLLTFWLGVQTFHRERATPGRGLFLGLAAATFTWAFGTLAWTHDLLPTGWADRVSYAGIMGVPALWLGTALQISGHPIARRHPWWPLLAALPQLPLYALLYSVEHRHWLLDPSQNGADGLGPLWWANAVWSWGLCLAGSLTLLASATSGPRRGSAMRIGLGIAALAPLAANLFYVTVDLQPPDTTPAVVAAALVILRSALFAGDLLPGNPLSQSDLLEALPVAALLTDRSGTVIAANAGAEARLGAERRDLLWRSLDAVVAGPGEHVETRSWPLVATGREVASFVWLDPESKEDPA